MKHQDKLKHLAVFGVLHYAILAALIYLRVPELLAIAVATFLVAAAAFLTEDYQKKIGRVKDGWDAFANMVGVSFSLFAFAFTNHLHIVSP